MPHDDGWRGRDGVGWFCWWTVEGIWYSLAQFHMESEKA